VSARPVSKVLAKGCSAILGFYARIDFLKGLLVYIYQSRILLIRTKTLGLRELGVLRYANEKGSVLPFTVIKDPFPRHDDDGSYFLAAQLIRVEKKHLGFRPNDRRPVQWVLPYPEI